MEGRSSFSALFFLGFFILYTLLGDFGSNSASDDSDDYYLGAELIRRWQIFLVRSFCCLLSAIWVYSCCFFCRINIGNGMKGNYFMILLVNISNINHVIIDYDAFIVFLYT